MEQFVYRNRTFAAGTMIWTVKDDAGDVSKYVRCDGVPSKIVEEARDDIDN